MTHRRSRRRLGAVVATLLVGATALAACGSSSSKNSAASTTTAAAAPSAPTVKAYGPGVTATTVKVGVLLIDYSCVKQFVDSIRENEKQTDTQFINYINDHGGVAGGKKIVPVFQSVCPVTNTGELAACTSFTEDDKVFAVWGTFYDPSGDAQLCFTKQHHTPIIADELTQALADQVPGGLIVTPDITPERRLRVILSLLAKHNTLKGKTVAILGENTAKPRIDSVVKPALKKMGVKTGAEALLTISGSDTSAAQQQVQSFIEKWKTQGVNALVLIGDAASSKQFVLEVRKAMPNVLLVADTTAVLDSAKDEQKAGVKPNPYDGIITAEGQTGTQHQQSPHGVFCHNIYESITGQKMPDPDGIVKDKHGQRLDLYGQIEDACLYPEMFKQIADRAGPYLNAQNWENAVNHFGHIEDMSTVYASLHQGKYDADDTYGLVAYDPSIPTLGDWKQLSPIENVGNA
ncbi:MAG TPA: hypothetical protein VGO03_00135 [Acidimicrobiia bacterium]